MEERKKFPSKPVRGEERKKFPVKKSKKKISVSNRYNTGKKVGKRNLNKKRDNTLGAKGRFDGTSPYTEE